MGKGYLLDTHSLLWALYEPKKIKPHILEVILDVSKPTYASAVSAFEISLKYARGKLDFAQSLALGFAREIAVPGFAPLALTPSHAQRAGLLNLSNRDPFDRMLIAQALVDDLVLVSNEELFDQSGVERLW